MSLKRALLLAGVLFSNLILASPLRLVSGEDYAPYAGSALPNGGMLSEVVFAALSSSGYQPSLAWQPWKRGYHATLKGSYDATYPYLKSAEREAEFLYSEPLYEVTQRVFTRRGMMLEPDNLQHFIGKRLCYPLGWLPPAALKPLLEQNQLQRHEPPDLLTCAKLLALGRDDFFVADSLLGQQAIHLSGLDPGQFDSSQAVVSKHSLHFIVPRNHPRATQLIDDFNRGLQQLMANGEYQRILQAHRSLTVE
ncbi:substrate-binding periplasmic protein [Aquipseudomonas guryensis]|jgi:polar amino acid transport system substrate-binding protein|uniref:Transporter substrate-binding domain-containing protein n=1 Tax=Aquipseudomonas guryensis TaxID=2759165 RepID=A0A7W4DEL4_9GAMM|nr:transporter substrate-binding domain-containing protein [Pseudomonas guryensis]MBB1521128.1 transporter substrate-binding domain-containing protein [Pseudomonas guryensis]